MMKLIIITYISTFLSIFFSALLLTCSAFPFQLQPPFMHEGAVNAIQQLSLPTLSRKLKFTEKVKEYDESTNLASNKKETNLPAGKQKMVVGKKETLREDEWMEVEDDPSQYFSMDYSRVKRRRPIHNKHFPLSHP